MKFLRMIVAVTSFFLTTLIATSADKDSATESVPSFDELYQLVRKHLTTVGEPELNRAAVAGFLAELKSEIILVTNGTPAGVPSPEGLVGKRTQYDGAFGYLRVVQVEAGLAPQISQVYRQLQSSNELKGLVLDLRFADGHDYKAAVEAADLFIVTEQPLIEVGPETLRSSAKQDALKLPVAVLVNQSTSGAAEALAAVLRQSATALVIGGTTAGRARVFEEFTLSNGQRLKLATQNTRLANGQELAGPGVVPDIAVTVNPDEERAFLEDPYRMVPRPMAQIGRLEAANSPANLSNTNRPRRRLNESELIRLRREGVDPDAESAGRNEEQSVHPVLADPALARALDFLKGVALVHNRR